MYAVVAEPPYFSAERLYLRHYGCQDMRKREATIRSIRFTARLSCCV